MKSYARFKKDLTEAVPLAAPLLAPLVPKILGGAAAAVGLGGMIHQATKQGQGGRSQPADYGQGDTAKPRGKSVQRPSGKMSDAELQRRQAIEDRKSEAKLRAQERRDAEQRDIEQKIDDLIGSQADRRYAKQRRAEENKKRQERNLDRLIDKAAKNIGVKLPN